MNESNNENIVERKFNGRTQYEVVVSDLSYVRVGNSWNYICMLLDLYNREIIGYSCGKHKDSALVLQAFASVKTNLGKLKIFHTDRGSEFKSLLLSNMLKEFVIVHSLSKKGSPIDNAVAESKFKSIKTEFVSQRNFTKLSQLENELMAYVYWFNNKRIHATLGYKSPVEYKQQLL